jgi:hypothetical protein
MTDNTIEFHEPVRIGDVLRTHQVLRSVSAEKTTKLGDRPLLGHRRRLHQPAATSWWRSSPTPASATSASAPLAMRRRAVGTQLPELPTR